MNNKIKGALLFLALGSLIPDAHAQNTAVCVMNPWAAGANALVQDTQTKQSVDATKDAITQMSKEITDALRQHSGQQTGNIQQRSQIDAAMRETQDNRGVQQRVEQARYVATLSASSGASGCNIMTGIVGSSGLFNTAMAAHAQLNKLSMNYQSGEDKDSSVRNGTQAAQEERFDGVCGKYGTQGLVDEGICKRVTQTNGAISSALDAGAIINSGVLNTDAQAAARVFVGNTFIPSPLAPVSKSLAATPEGRQSAAARWTSIGRNGIALDTINGIISSRMPAKDDGNGGTVRVESSLSNPGAAGSGATGNPATSLAFSGTTPTTTVRQWAEGTAKGMLGYSSAGNNFPDGVSLWAWMDLRSKSFYLDPNFQSSVNSHDVNQNSKDMTLIMGYQTYLQWEQFKQQEKTNLLLASIVSMMDQQATARETSSNSR